MKYLIIFILIAFTISMQSCKEKSETEELRDRLGNGIEINTKELVFSNLTNSTGMYNQSVAISLIITNNTSSPFIFNFSNVTGRSKASFNPGLKRPGSIIELDLINGSEMEKVLNPGDSTALNLRIRTDFNATTLEEMLEEFSSDFSGEYDLYLINLGVNKTFRTEIDVTRMPKTFYLDSKKVELQDSLTTS